MSPIRLKHFKGILLFLRQRPKSLTRFTRPYRVQPLSASPAPTHTVFPPLLHASDSDHLSVPVHISLSPIQGPLLMLFRLSMMFFFLLSLVSIHPHFFRKVCLTVVNQIPSPIICYVKYYAYLIHDISHHCKFIFIYVTS